MTLDQDVFEDLVEIFSLRVDVCFRLAKQTKVCNAVGDDMLLMIIYFLIKIVLFLEGLAKAQSIIDIFFGLRCFGVPWLRVELPLQDLVYFFRLLLHFCLLLKLLQGPLLVHEELTFN